MKIEVNVGKKYAFLIVASVFILAGIFLVYAYNSNPADPSKFGHSINELDGIVCLQGQAISRNTSGWFCMNVNPSESVDRITAGKGILVNSNTGNVNVSVNGSLVSGTVLGGAYGTSSLGSVLSTCNSWGIGTCTGSPNQYVPGCKQNASIRLVSSVGPFNFDEDPAKTYKSYLCISK